MNLRWTKKKPKRWKECLLLTATWMNYHEPYYWDYKLFTVKQADGEDEEGNYNFIRISYKVKLAWYWGIFMDDDEWGDIADLTADKYCVLPLLQPNL